MYMILMLHMLGHGGFFEKVEWLSWNYLLGSGLLIASFCSVNCYALISGYVCYGQKFDYARIIRLWLEVVFYTVGITVLFAWFMPEKVRFVDWINAFFPVLRDQYWYVTAYFALFFCMPFLNFLVDRLEKKQFIKLLLTLIILFSIIPTVAFNKDGFAVRDGYSPLWLGVLYLLGIYIKKYNWLSRLSSKVSLLLFAGCTFLVMASKIVMEMITSRLLGVPRHGEILLAYSSPLMVAAAIFLFMACLRKTYSSPKWVACITFLAPLSFGVYLFHCQSCIWRYWMDGRFVSYGELPPWQMLAAVLLTGAGIYMVGSLVDFIRLKVFQVCRIRMVSTWMVSWLRKGYDKVFYWREYRE